MAVTVLATGWEVLIEVTGPVAGAWDFGTDAAPTLALTVESDGFDSAGVAATVTRTIYARDIMRNPYANQATLQEIDIGGGQMTGQLALSERIYNTDTVTGFVQLSGLYTPPAGAASAADSGAVTNNSAFVAPLPHACWMTENRFDIDSTEEKTFKLFVSHAHGANGVPVAAVKFTFANGAESVDKMVSTLSSTTFDNGQTAQHYQTSFNPTTEAFTLDTEMSVDATIYPVIGLPFQISIDATGGVISTYYGPNLHPLIGHIVDPASNRRKLYAYVDNAGNNGTGVASDVPATAAANPFLTVPAAEDALLALRTVTYGTASNSQCHIRLNAGVHILDASISSTVDTGGLWIEATDPADRATTILRDRGSSLYGGTPNWLNIKDITLQMSNIGGTIVFLDTYAGKLTNEHLNYINCLFDINGDTAYGSWVHRVGSQNAINCQGDDLLIGRAIASFHKTLNAIGSSGCGGTGTYNLIGAKGDIFSSPLGSANTPVPYGGVVAFCALRSDTDGAKVALLSGAATGARGTAVVMSTLEQTAGDTGAALDAYADGNIHPCQNVLLAGITVVGSQTNYLYNDTAAVVQKDGVQKYSIHNEMNSKTDVFAVFTTEGNWSEVYNVDDRYSTYLEGASDSAAPGTGNWIGQILPVGATYGSGGSPIDPDFIDDASFYGTGLGDGDYRPQSPENMPSIPAGEALYSRDYMNQPIPNNGTAAVGALQPEVIPGGGYGNYSRGFGVGIGVGVAGGTAYTNMN